MNAEQRPAKNPPLLVTAACMRNGDTFLIARRREGLRMAGLWEFPGGKVEPHESGPSCLARELQEEFGITVAVGDHLTSVDHSYPRGRIRLMFYEVAILSGTFELREHDAIAWVTLEEAANYELAPADLPFVAWLRERSEK